MPNISGSLEDFDGNPLTHGQVIVEPWGDDSRVDGTGLRLGWRRWEIKDLPDPLVLDAAAYRITLRTSLGMQVGNARKDAFTTKVWTFDLDANVTWADIRDGNVTDVPMTPSLVQQASDARDDATAARDLAEGYRDDAAAFGGTNNTQVAGMVTGAGPTKDALSATSATPLDVLPNEHPFWYVTRPQSINGRVYASTAGDNSDVYLQEWTQPGGTGKPVWLRRYLLGYAGVGTTMDDHVLAGLAVKPGKPLVALWCGHSFDNVILYRATLKNIDDYEPNETLTFGPTKRFEIPGDQATSYCEVMIHGDNIWVLHRTGNPVMRWSLTKFPTWATGTPQRVELLSSVDQFYAMGRIVGDVIRIQVADHPDLGTDNKLWYCEVNVTTGAVTKADGTSLGSFDPTTFAPTGLPLAEASLEELFVATGTEKPWVFDVGYGATRELVFTSGRQAPNFGTTGDYLYAKYVAGAWVINTICPVGEFMIPGGAYFPSITFDPTTPGAVYLVREQGGIHYLERRVTADNGATWATTVIDTYDATGSTVASPTNTVPTLNRAFPVERPDGLAPLFNLLATEIDYYPTYTDWRSRFRPMPRSLAVKRLPDELLGFELERDDYGTLVSGAGSYILGEDVPVPTGAVRLEVDVALDSWATGTDQQLLGKESSGTTRSCRLSVGSDGKLKFTWSTDGTALNTVVTTAALGFAAKQRAEVGVVFIPVHDATHYWLNFLKRMPGEKRWTKIEGFSPAASATSIFNSTSRWEVGTRWNGATERGVGTYYRASVLTRGEQVVTEFRSRDLERGFVYRDRKGFTWAAQAKPLGAAAWNGPDLFALGGFFFWVDGSGRLRIKSGKPTSDTDGAIVGTQT